jgi:hypothetical protein
MNPMIPAGWDTISYLASTRAVKCWDRHDYVFWVQIGRWYRSVKGRAIQSVAENSHFHLSKKAVGLFGFTKFLIQTLPKLDTLGNHKKERLRTFKNRPKW